MVIQGTWKDQHVTISAKPNCLTVSLESKGMAQVFSYDYAGRLWTALLDGISYRRGLDGKMVAKWQTKNGEAPTGRDRCWLTQVEALEIESRARQTMADLWESIEQDQAQMDPGVDAQTRQGFQRLLAFDEDCSRQDAARYAQVYKPVGILPPDQYMAVVLQATEGCAFNTCTYCTFFRDRPFRIKAADEFRGHAEAVRAYLGDGLSLRRTIFLGDANALITPMPRLVPLMEEIHLVFDVERLGGMYAFLDGFSGGKKTAEDYRHLAELGLVRVYLGLESGHAPLLKFLHKPGKPEDAVQAVRAMKAGGVSVGVIVLLGAGGRTYSEGHVRDTIQALNEMRLDLNDIVYFSELLVDERMQYARDAYQANLAPLSPEERILQGERIERGLKFSPQRGIPPISRYDIREFIY